MSTAEPTDIPEAFEVLAGGGLVWRHAGDPSGEAYVHEDGVRSGLDASLEVLVAHRSRYDDWTLPKGKLDPGETLEDCAIREVREETGLRCELGPVLTDVTYRDHKHRSKLVRYWAMRVVGGRFEPNDEVDEVRWVPLAEVADELTYPHDRSVVDAFRTRRRDGSL